MLPFPLLQEGCEVGGLERHQRNGFLSQVVPTSHPSRPPLSPTSCLLWLLKCWEAALIPLTIAGVAVVQREGCGSSHEGWEGRRERGATQAQS